VATSSCLEFTAAWFGLIIWERIKITWADGMKSNLLKFILELISLAYQPWYNVFLSQQNNISRFISRKNHQPNSSQVPS
jgi:hypothetical protein